MGILLLLALVVFCTSGIAGTIPIGFIAYDEPDQGFGVFNIVNMTGPNAFDPDFPVITSVDLLNLDLTVLLADGTTVNYDPISGYFSGDGMDPVSYNGTQFSIPPLPYGATLKGSFSVLNVTLANGTTGTISPDFIAVFDRHASSDPAVLGALLGNDPSDPLVAGDFKIIEADFTPSLFLNPVHSCCWVEAWGLWCWRGAEASNCFKTRL